MNFLIGCFLIFLPSKIKCILLRNIFSFKIHDKSKIGFSLINVLNLKIGENGSIGNFNYISNLENLEIGNNSQIGKFNRITGCSTLSAKVHFKDDFGRVSELILEENSAISNSHILDCSSSIRIGKFTIIGGFGSQVLTHSVEFSCSIQKSKPVNIGSYSFISSGCIILPGSSLPDFSILGAASLLNKRYSQTYSLYGGVPAKLLKPLDKNMKYFSRKIGFIS